MIANIFLIVVGGSLLLAMIYSFYLVIFTKSDKKLETGSHKEQAKTADRQHHMKKARMSQAR